jgi:hypothetical protein
MSIKRYVADKDNVITNAFQSNLTTRGTGSNMGLADSLETFSIYAQANSSSNEQARTLVQFPISSISADRTSGKLPASGNVNFVLRMFNVEHTDTVPRDFTLTISPVSQSWEEGYGLDMDNYTDLTYNGTGSNWINAGAGTTWTTAGGDYLTTPSLVYTASFDTGIEDLEVDITNLVEQWITGTAGGGIENYGIGVQLTSSQTSGSRSYYTKKFSARSSEYFFKRPVIEARWDDTRRDNRGNFFISSSALSADNNLNTLFIYNFYRGQLTNIADIGTGSIYVSLHTSASGGDQLTATPNNPVTGGWAETGIYSASFALNTSASTVFDRWFSGSTYYHTGSFTPTSFDSSNINSIERYVTTITNLENEYYNNDITRLRLFTRLKDWSPTIYTVASTEIQNNFIEDAFYKVVREVDSYDVIGYGTGSLNHTRLSYDVTGSYFDLDMSLLEPGYSYAIKFVYYINGAYEEQRESFRFRVKE